MALPSGSTLRRHRTLDVMCPREQCVPRQCAARLRARRRGRLSELLRRVFLPLLSVPLAPSACYRGITKRTVLLVAHVTRAMLVSGHTTAVVSTDGTLLAAGMVLLSDGSIGGMVLNNGDDGGAVRLAADGVTLELDPSKLARNLEIWMYRPVEHGSLAVPIAFTFSGKSGKAAGLDAFRAELTALVQSSLTCLSAGRRCDAVFGPCSKCCDTMLLPPAPAAAGSTSAPLSSSSSASVTPQSSAAAAGAPSSAAVGGSALLSSAAASSAVAAAAAPLAPSWAMRVSGVRRGAMEHDWVTGLPVVPVRAGRLPLVQQRVYAIIFAADGASENIEVGDRLHAAAHAALAAKCEACTRLGIACVRNARSLLGPCCNCARFGYSCICPQLQFYVLDGSHAAKNKANAHMNWILVRAFPLVCVAFFLPFPVSAASLPTR
jgi:hypothetical protein